MKTFFAILFLSCSSLLAKDLGVDFTDLTAPTGVQTVPGRSKSVTFTFGTPALQSCTVNIAGKVFTAGDGSLTLEAEEGDTIGPITYSLTSGTMRILRTQ